MIKSIRHLRANADEWERSDIVIPDGELALLKTKAGNVRIKIGNGESKFSQLPSITGDSLSCSEESLLLLHGRSYRFKETPSLTLHFPDILDDDYYAEVSFDSGTDATEFSISGKARLTGDDVADEELLPKPHTHYTVFFWFDGEIQGIVRGLPNA